MFARTTRALMIGAGVLTPATSNDIPPGDSSRIELPYAAFVYRAATHRIVTSSDLAVLRRPRHEQLELQALSLQG